MKSSVEVIYNFGNQIIYECRTGYMSKQKGIFTCGEDGKWRGDFECELIECPPPLKLENGEINHKSDFSISNDVVGLYVYNSKIEMKCKEGYRLIGSNVRYCLVNGTWSSSEPYCDRIKCNLSQLPVDDSTLNRNGYFIISGNFYDDWVTYKCNEGYKLSETSFLEELRWTCNLNGSWILSNFLSSAVKISKPLCYQKPEKCPEPKVSFHNSDL